MQVKAPTARTLPIFGMLDGRAGVTSIEYALIAGIVALALISGARIIGVDLGNIFLNVDAHLTPPAAG
jgi:Flp pilus assembly pilin Flp